MDPRSSFAPALGQTPPPSHGSPPPRHTQATGPVLTLNPYEMNVPSQHVRSATRPAEPMYSSGPSVTEDLHGARSAQEPPQSSYVSPYRRPSHLANYSASGAAAERPAAGPAPSPFAGYASRRIGHTEALSSASPAVWGTPLATSSPAPVQHYQSSVYREDEPPLVHTQPMSSRPFYVSQLSRPPASVPLPPPAVAASHQQQQQQQQQPAQYQQSSLSSQPATTLSAQQASPDSGAGVGSRSGLNVVARGGGGAAAAGGQHSPAALGPLSTVLAGGHPTADALAGLPVAPSGYTTLVSAEPGIRAVVGGPAPAAASSYYDDELQRGHPDQVQPGMPQQRKKRGLFSRFGKRAPEILPPDQPITVHMNAGQHAGPPGAPATAGAATGGMAGGAEWSSLHADLRMLLQDPVFSDVVFYVEGQAVRAHKCILAARCPSFLEMFRESGPESEFEITNVSHAAFSAVLAFVYMDRTQVTLKLAMELLSALTSLKIASLKELCQGFLLSQICVENAAWMYQGAVQHDCSMLRAAALDFIVVHFDEVSRTHAFQELDRAPIVQVIRERSARGSPRR